MPESNENREPTESVKTADFHCGYAALIGKPNVGKSTLMNAILGTKLSIVSRKPQTTRKQVVGMYNDEAHQIIFVDTPGIIQPRYKLQAAMMEEVRRAMADCDCFLVMTDAEKSISHHNTLPEEITSILPMLDGPVFLILNKVDRVRDKALLLPLMDRCARLHPFRAIIPTSALRGEGIDTLLREVGAVLPHHPPFYPTDILSEQPLRFFASEIIREKIFEQYREEIPYSTAVEIVVYEERKDGKDFISAEILVEKETQRRIMIGGKGAALKQIGTDARRDIEALVEKEVYLELHVKVREGWRDSTTWLRNLGYATNG